MSRRVFAETYLSPILNVCALRAPPSRALKHFAHDPEDGPKLTSPVNITSKFTRRAKRDIFVRRILESDNIVRSGKIVRGAE